MNDSFPGYSSFNIWQDFIRFVVLHGCVTWIWRCFIQLLAVTGVIHEGDDAYSIRSTWLCYG